jgi:hypothetical protein
MAKAAFRNAAPSAKPIAINASPVELAIVATNPTAAKRNPTS